MGTFGKAKIDIISKLRNVSIPVVACHNLQQKQTGLFTMTNKIANRLRVARESTGFSNASKAAKALGIKYSTYVAHENGTRGFSTKVAAEYAECFKVSLEWLLTGREKKLIAACENGDRGANDSSSAFDPPQYLDRKIQHKIPPHIQVTSPNGLKNELSAPDFEPFFFTEAEILEAIEALFGEEKATIVIAMLTMMKKVRNEK